MITGFNTDVRHEGHVYHVQSEDRGKDNKILESLIYVGGTIVAKKRTPYPGPIAGDAGQAELTSLLKRQHQVIIAAIKAGRIDDLIRHSGKQQTGEEPGKSRQSQNLPPVRIPAPPSAAQEIVLPRTPPAVTTKPSEGVQPSNPPPPRAPEVTATSKPGRSGGRNSGSLKPSPRPSTPRGDTAGLNLDQVLDDYKKRGAGQAKLDVKVLTPEVFVAGQGIGLRVQVTRDAKAEFDGTVTVKIIGTAFRPQVFIGRLGRDGVANFSLTLPAFSTGTAAIVIEAQSGAGRGELKKLIRRA